MILGFTVNIPLASIELVEPGPKGDAALNPPSHCTGKYGGGGDWFGAGSKELAPVYGETKVYTNSSPSGSVAEWSKTNSCPTQSNVGG